MLSQDCTTPLHYAAQNGHDSVVMYLINSGAEVDACNTVRNSMC